ncbi:hypothetical protein [Parerythrobacter jejuensis]|uniref:DUF11 domain-containing protein n=1 Tax=Parerythrobacter jejuensis TaxID=795812 RepID=A0A845AZK5_9SPHN|nr:hypothetical protein [Parerythrobacter jejuensis]MXP32178.1 hypothetical protein [Parerythrobacter jejuensis]
MKKDTNTFRYLGLTAILAVGVPSAAHAGGVDAGTLIENTAQATYDTADGTETIDSNTVTLKVDELLDVTVTSLDPGPVSTQPGSDVLTFELTNTGNGPEAYTLTANPAVAGNDFDSTVDGIAVDTNGNGVYDDGIDAILTAPATTAEIAADGTLTVFVLLTVPAGATDTQESQVELTAEAVTGTGAPGTTFAGAGVDGSDAIVGVGGADDSATGDLVVAITTVDLVKSATVADPFGGTSAVPGATITFSIRADVQGSTSVDDLVITDAIPTNTTYQPGTLALDGGGLTDASGDDAGEASATGISVDLGTVAGGSAPTITFDVVIDE